MQRVDRSLRPVFPDHHLFHDVVHELPGNEILERNFALKAIWTHDNYFNARSMDVYITKLRKHLKDEPSVEIINVHGKGYKLIM